MGEHVEPGYPGAVRLHQAVADGAHGVHDLLAAAGDDERRGLVHFS
jgi:hypothetical protein